MNDVRETDLFGNPVRARKGLRGRPAKELGSKDLDALEAGLTQGWTNQRLAEALGVGLSTLKRNFGPLLSTRSAAPDRLRLALMATTFRKALEGDMAAMRLARQIVHEGQMLAAEAELRAAQGAVGDETEGVMGKKAMARIAARQAELAPEWGDDLAFSGGKKH